MKKNIILLSFLITLLSSCSTTDNNSYSFHSSTSTTQHITSFTSSFEISSSEPFFTSSIPYDFFYEENHYKMNIGIDLSIDEVSTFFGYFINLEDLEKWEEFDKLEDIVYVTDKNNAIYNYDSEEKMSNRFELYLTFNTDQLALKANGSYYSYKIIDKVSNV